MKDYPKVLVACPTYEGKGYCFPEWISMAKGLTYPNYEILVVDNSKTPDYYNQYKDQIPMIHREEVEGEKDNCWYRVCQSMGIIRDYFLANDFDYWMNIEADVIPPPNVIEVLLSLAQAIDGDWVQHCYPATPNPVLMQGIGCALLSKRLVNDFNWSDPTIADDSPDSELWGWVQKNPPYKTVELWYVMDVAHLK